MGFSALSFGFKGQGSGSRFAFEVIHSAGPSFKDAVSLRAMFQLVFGDVHGTDQVLSRPPDPASIFKGIRGRTERSQSSSQNTLKSTFRDRGGNPSTFERGGHRGLAEFEGAPHFGHLPLMVELVLVHPPHHLLVVLVLPRVGVWAQGLGLKVSGSGFGVWGLGFRVQGAGFRV